ncbi:MAG: hypothetical protein ABJC12_03650 [Saprospiraceae bacterium]
MKKIFSMISCLMMILVPVRVITAQGVSISSISSTPDASAILDLKSTTQGILVPRMTGAQRMGIALPAIGLLVYDTDTQSFWYRSATVWTNLTSGGGSGSGWSMTGNVATGTDFLGTTNNQSLLLKANNLQAGKIDLITNNTTWGSRAGESITSASSNTGLGFNSIHFTTIGSSNTAVGFNALLNNTTGYSNIAVGANALFINNTRNNIVAIGDSALYHNEMDATAMFHATANTAIGSKALYANTTGYQNTAVGFRSMYSNTTGLNNSAFGVNALYLNSSGAYNTAFGKDALFANLIGSFNSANGFEALYSNTSGNGNSAIGREALYSNTSGSNNTAIGMQSLYTNDIGENNTAIGVNTLYSNTLGLNNTANGMNALSSNMNGSYNAAFGNNAMLLNSSGSFNSAVGNEALFFNMSGASNTSIGRKALYSNSTGSRNTAIGDSSLYQNNTGINNTAIGYAADVMVDNLSNATAVGFNAKVGASNSLVLGGTGADAVKVGIGTTTPTATLEVNGQVKITGGMPGANKVLTSNAVGLATWQPNGQSDFAYIYNVVPQFVQIETSVFFDSNGSMTSGFFHIPGTSDLTIINAGAYKVNFSISGNEPNQFALFLNGVLIQGSIYGSGNGTQQNNGQIVFSASAGDILALRNHSSNAGVSLATIVGGTQSNVNASILIERL